MKKLFYCFTLIIMLTLLSGCYIVDKSELYNYINDDIAEVINIEDEVISQYETAKTSRDFFHKLDNEIIPKYSDFLNQLTGINTNSSVINEAHRLYINGAEKQLYAFKLLKEGLGNNDNNAVDKANALLKESNSLMQSYKIKITKLIKKYN